MTDGNQDSWTVAMQIENEGITQVCQPKISPKNAQLSPSRKVSQSLLLLPPKQNYILFITRKRIHEEERLQKVKRLCSI